MDELKQDAVEWLTEQCSRLKYGQCSTIGCLMRGGYKRGQPPHYGEATCEAYEIMRALDATSPVALKEQP